MTGINTIKQSTKQSDLQQVYNAIAGKEQDGQNEEPQTSFNRMKFKSTTKLLTYTLYTHSVTLQFCLDAFRENTVLVLVTSGNLEAVIEKSELY